jgi:hypothetical protein
MYLGSALPPHGQPLLAVGGRNVVCLNGLLGRRLAPIADRRLVQRDLQVPFPIWNTLA